MSACDCLFSELKLQHEQISYRYLNITALTLAQKETPWVYCPVLIVHGPIKWLSAWHKALVIPVLWRSVKLKVSSGDTSESESRPKLRSSKGLTRNPINVVLLICVIFNLYRRLRVFHLTKQPVVENRTVCDHAVWSFLLSSLPEGVVPCWLTDQFKRLTARIKKHVVLQKESSSDSHV